METLTTHGCGKSWKQRGNRTGHCGRCHETFEGTALFDSHFIRQSDGTVRCKDPRGRIMVRQIIVRSSEDLGEVMRRTRTVLTRIAIGIGMASILPASYFAGLTLKAILNF